MAARSSVDTGSCTVCPATTPGPVATMATRSTPSYAHWTLQHQTVIAQPLSMIRREDHEGVVVQAKLMQRCVDPTDLVVDLRNHAVVVRNDLPQLRVRLRGHATEILT